MIKLWLLIPFLLGQFQIGDRGFKPIANPGSYTWMTTALLGAACSGGITCNNNSSTVTLPNIPATGTIHIQDNGDWACESAGIDPSNNASCAISFDCGVGGGGNAVNNTSPMTFSGNCSGFTYTNLNQIHVSSSVTASDEDGSANGSIITSYVLITWTGT